LHCLTHYVRSQFCDAAHIGIFRAITTFAESLHPILRLVRSFLTIYEKQLACDLYHMGKFIM